MSSTSAQPGPVMPTDRDLGYPTTLGELKRDGALKPAYRQAVVQGVDEERRTAELVFATDNEIERGWWLEILDMSRDAADLERLNSGAQLLVNHDVNMVAGVVESARIRNGRGEAVVRFGEGEFAEDIFRDVRTGIRQLVSFAYYIRKIERVVSEENEPDRIYIRSWEALEISIVSVPADPAAGVGRGFGQWGVAHLPDNHLAAAEARSLTISERKEEVMPHQDDKKTPDPAITPDPKSRSIAPAPEPMDMNEIRKTERERVREIEASAKKFGIDDQVAQRAINEGMPLSDFRDLVMGILLERDDDVQLDGRPAAQLDLTNREVESYSMMRALQAMLLAGSGKGAARDLAPFEFECHDAIAERSGKSSAGILVPTDILIAPRQLTRDHLTDLVERGMWGAVQREVKTRDLDSVTAGGAAELVGTDHLAASFIELLRARILLRRLGARVLSGLVGNVDIPKQTAGGTAAFVSETGPTPQNELQTGRVQLSPKTLGNRQVYSRRLMLQSAPSIEAMVRDDLIREFALAADLAGINGGGGNAPTGILNTAGIAVVAIDVNGGPLTWAKVVEFETAVAQGNADVGTTAYLTNPGVRGHAKTVEKAANTAQFLWPEGALNADGIQEMNSYRAGVTTQVPNNLTKGAGTDLSAMIFGNFADSIFGEWGTLELLLDPYTGSTTSQIAMQGWMEMDFVVRRTASFANCVDIDPS